MANKIILKKSSVASKVPLATDLEIGEIAVNLADQKLYSKNASGTVVLVGTGTATGTVTSVTGTSPVTSSGGTTPAISLASGYGDTQNPYASKTAKYFLAAPNASAGAPTFRAIVASDIPTLNQNTTGSSGSCTGNAATATTLQTARTINGVSFNGSSNITVTATATNALTLGSYLTGTSYNGSAAVTAAVDATTTATASKIVARNENGDIYSRYDFCQYVNMSHSAATRNTDTVFYSSTDAYIRKNTDDGFRTSLAVPKAGAGGAIVENTNTIAANYTMTTGSNGMSAGPVSVNSGVTVTIPTGSTWVIV